MKDLDELVNEAFDFLNRQLNSGGFNLWDHINAQQEAAEKRVAALKKKGATKTVIKKAEDKLNVKIGKETKPKSETAGTDDVNAIKNISNLKGKMYYKLIEFCNVVGGVGDNGDRQLQNAGVKSPDRDRKIQKRLNDLLKDVEQLKKYEALAPRRYTRMAHELEKVLGRINVNELEWEKKEAPRSFNATDVKTGPRINQNSAEKYAEIQGKRVPKGFEHKVTNDKIRNIGAPRYNADIYEDLLPFIREFRKYTKYDPHNIDLEADQMSNVAINREKRQSDMKNAIAKGFKHYKKQRKSEQNIDNISRAKDDAKGSDGKIVMKDYHQQRNAGQQALKQSFKIDGLSTNNSILKAKNIEKINITKFRKIVADWIAKGEKKVVKLFGTTPLTGDGNLIFMPTDTPAQNQFQFEGLYAFKVSKQFYNNLTSEQKQFFEDKRKDTAWKNKIRQALGLKSVMTESSYFDY